MVKNLQTIDVTDTPEILHLAEEVARSGVPRVLRTAHEELAMVVPVAPARSRGRRDRPVTREDSLFGLIGMGSSGIPGGASERKHEFLARAYRPRQ